MQSERPSRSEAIHPPSGRDYQLYDVLKPTVVSKALEKKARASNHLKRFVHVQHVFTYTYIDQILDKFYLV